MPVSCRVYKSSNKAQTYLYVKTNCTLDTLPEGLITLLGELTPFLTLELNASTKLAQVNVVDVINQLNENSYFLQLPPNEANVKTVTA